MEVGQELVSKSLNEVPGFAAVFAPPWQPALLSSRWNRSRFPFLGRGLRDGAASLGLPPSKGGRWQSQNQPKCLKLPQKERLGGLVNLPGGRGGDAGSWSAFGVRPSLGLGRDVPGAPGTLPQPRGSGEHSLGTGHPAAQPDTALGGFSLNTHGFLGPKLPEMGAGDAQGRGERCSRSVLGRGTRGIKAAKSLQNAAK